MISKVEQIRKLAGARHDKAFVIMPRYSEFKAAGRLDLYVWARRTEQGRAVMANSLAYGIFERPKPAWYLAEQHAKDLFTKAGYLTQHMPNNNPVFDLKIGQKTVDVKFAAGKKRRPNELEFRLNLRKKRISYLPSADFYLLSYCQSTHLGEEWHYFLLPKQVIVKDSLDRVGSVGDYVTTTYKAINRRFSDFEVTDQPTNLRSIFEIGVPFAKTRAGRYLIKAMA